MKKRIGCIDVFRGFCIFWMLIGHIFVWWTESSIANAFYAYIVPIFDSLGAAGFIFISGLSLQFSYRKKLKKDIEVDKSEERIVRNSYFIRASFLLIIALIFNLGTIFQEPDKSYIFSWWILFTISVILLLYWPLLKLSWTMRAIIGLGILILDPILLNLLLAYSDISPLIEILYNIFYTPDNRQNPLLTFFPFFIFGSVLGDQIKKIDFNGSKSNKDFLKRFSLPLCGISIGMILFGILFQFPLFLIRNSYTWVIYGIGLQILVFSILLTIEKLELINFNSKYNFLFYYSYYSFSIYLLNFVLMLLPIRTLNLSNIWFALILVTVLFTLLAKVMYDKIKALFSLKYLISRTSEFFALKIEEKFYNQKPVSISFLKERLKRNLIEEKNKNIKKV